MSEQKIDQNATVANVQKNEDAVVKPTKPFDEAKQWLSSR